MRKKNLMALLTAAAVAATTIMGGAMVTWAEEEEVVEEGGEESADDGETAEIKVALMCLTTMDSSATDHVEEALNEMLLEKINVQADITWYDATTYMTQVPMSLQAGETVDLIMFTPMPGASYQSFRSQNQLMDITEYVDEYGPDIKEVMGDYLDATTVDGSLYGVGNMVSLYASEILFMRKDVLDDLGLTEKAENMESWAELKEILEEVVANTDLKGMANADAEGSVISSQPYLNPGDTFADSYGVDVVGDSYQYIYADPETDEIKCYFFNDDWYKNMEIVKDYYDAGLIYKDAATATEYGDNQIKNGVSFAMVKGSEEGAKGSSEAATGYELVTKEITTGLVSTGAFQKFGFAVPVTAEEPEAAIKFLNLLFSDAEVLDTLTWGVEGVDYEVNDDGTLTYPEGVTADTVTYHTADFLYGDRLLVTPWEGEGADIREKQAASNETAEKSKYFGFTVDSTDVSTEYAACKNVIDQYKPLLSSGSEDDLESTYEQFKSELEAAGIQTIIDTYQAQLDEWLAQQ